MIQLASDSPGHFCWLDLAATDACAALGFYQRLFDWNAREHPANGGSITRLARDGRDVGSLYQINRRDLRNGMPSHWTPYVRVTGLDGAVQRATTIGGRLLVAPFTVDGIARIALIEDAVGALIGLWERLTFDALEFPHGENR